LVCLPRILPLTSHLTLLPPSGKYQHSHARVTAKPNVLYHKGGDDFRTPGNTSCLGKQVTSSHHTSTAPKVPFPRAPRFDKSETLGPGPNMSQPSSFKKQFTSNRRDSPSMHFGTSTRDDCLKQYAIYTTKK
jgi:hypothetical protein